mgnify:CR=1 FL=1
MCHLRALPGDVDYDQEKSLAWVYECAREDIKALQAGGVDAVLFSNEFSLPYLTRVETITVACVASIIAQLKSDLEVPFGVDVLWDPRAAIDLAMATGAQFVREVFTGVYGSDLGLWNTNCGKVIRYQYAIGAQHARLFFNIVPESAAYLAPRQIADIARSRVFNTRPDALCVSGLMPGVAASSQVLEVVKNSVPEVPIFANTGVRPDNIADQLAIADGAIIGTAFKKDGNTWNPVDVDRVKVIMQEVEKIRKGL